MEGTCSGPCSASDFVLQDSRRYIKADGSPEAKSLTFGIQKNKVWPGLYISSSNLKCADQAESKCNP